MYSSRETHAQTFKGKVTRVAKNKRFFSMQVKGMRGSKTVFTDGKGREPRDGLFLYGIEFSPAGKNKTIALSYSPWGWGNVVDTVIDAAAGKYKRKCPPKSDRFPGAK